MARFYAFADHQNHLGHVSIDLLFLNVGYLVWGEILSGA